jgi:hypothetical protein
MIPMILSIKTRSEALTYLKQLPQSRQDREYIDALIESLNNMSDADFTARLPLAQIAATKAAIEQFGKLPPDLDINTY